MFTGKELTFLQLCVNDESLEDDIREHLKSLQAKVTALNERQGNMLFTADELLLMQSCAFDTSFSPKNREEFAQIAEKMMITKINKPQVIVTIEDGCYQYSHSNMPVELIIEDIDAMSRGDGLLHTSQAGASQKEFDSYIEKSAKRFLREARIFVHDSGDTFPYQVMVNDEIINTFKTFEEAANFLYNYAKKGK
jgi:hypothetical protein